MLSFIIAALVLVVLGTLAYAASRPNDFRIVRSTRIAAPARDILPRIDDFHAWSSWSPYEKLDPSMQRTYGGAQRGVGAVYQWESKGKAGAGRMEVLEVEPDARVQIALDFTKPFVAHNVAEFTFAPDAGGTKVTWLMRGPSPFMSKLFGVFVNIDRMVGRDFETGLANLKSECERAAPAGQPVG